MGTTTVEAVEHDEAFAKLSGRIARIAEKHRTRMRTRLACALEMWIRLKLNSPMRVRWISEGGEPVGEPVPVFHLRLHDMMPHAADWTVTDLILSQGERINALKPYGTEHLPNNWGKTMIQPCWIKPA